MPIENIKVQAQQLRTAGTQARTVQYTEKSSRSSGGGGSSTRKGGPQHDCCMLCMYIHSMVHNLALALTARDKHDRHMIHQPPTTQQTLVTVRTLARASSVMKPLPEGSSSRNASFAGSSLVASNVRPTSLSPNLRMTQLSCKRTKNVSMIEAEPERIKQPPIKQDM